MKHLGRSADLLPLVASETGSAGRLRAGWLALVGLLALSLTGCPPTGDVPPFNPVFADAGGDGGPDSGVDPCLDSDDDGYVVGTGCALPAGDCAPADPARNPGADEACNLRDDDCDGVSDEANPGGGVECTSDQPGICAAGLTVCRQGNLNCEPIERREVAEACNGLDDDCDGTTDEDVPGLGGNCQTGDPGVCAAGVQSCVSGSVRCVPEQVAAAERCNGLDDDCDGSTDEGNPDSGGACNTNLAGTCAVGILRCSGGEASCTQSTTPVPETCNGLDDDCDGNTDETWPAKGNACATGVGACNRPGVQVCTADGTGLICDAVAGAPVAERCNVIDDDCDGRLDEGFALAEVCTNGVGACQRPGLTICEPGGDVIICNAEPGESFDEQCNAIDDDCDGRVDELFPTLGQACVNVAGQCPSPGLFVCAGNGNGVTCAADPVQPVPETCNDFDDDCDGSIDETYANKGTPCSVGVGACVRDGTQICNENGGLSCSALAGEVAVEACNGLDDDCDGRLDEGAPCLGAPAGVVVALRVAAAGDAGCADLTGDGQPDNALAGLGAVVNPRLARALAAGERPLVVRANGDLAEGFRLDFLEAVTDANALPVPRLDAFTAQGEARQSLAGYRLSENALAGGVPGAVDLPSLLVYAPTLAAPRLSALRTTRLDGPLALVEIEGAMGLAGSELVLSAQVNRAALLANYALVDAACAAAPTPPADCAGRPSPAALAGVLVADVNADGVGGAESLSLCLRLDLAPVAGPATPPTGAITCTADTECYAGLVCRGVAVPAANPELGNALARRCVPPGAGAVAVGGACEFDDDCTHGLCLATTAQGGVCADLCSAERPCGAGLACRGVPVAVEGALGAGGNSAHLCVPTPGTGDACGARNSCSGGEVCAPFLGGAVGVAGGVVTVAPRCHIPTPGAAALGAACAHDLDCVHGLGCVENLSGAQVCAALCTGGSQCAVGEVCTPRPVPVLADVSRSHGVCLAVPAVLGSARRCATDATCAPTETCRADFLAPVGQPDAFCGVGTGFFAVGQPCAAGGDCLSGVCAAGFCGGPCQNANDCGPASACNPGAWVDRVSGATAAACGPIAGACVLDRDCNARSAACVGDRCVCEGNTCRLGCRDGGRCVDGTYCQPDGVCTPYCRVDRAEPDDTLAQALNLPFGRGTPTLDRDASLCATSPVDFYQFVSNGQGFTVRVTPSSPPAGTRLEVAVVAADGAIVARAESGGAAAPGVVQVQLNAAQAASRAGQALFVRVRAAGTFESLSYNLALTLTVPVCADPDASEPQDEPWQVTELLATPGAAANVQRDGAICPADTDWYGIYLGNGDTLTLNLANQGNGGAEPSNLEVTLMGPDWPALPGATTRATLVPGQNFVFTPPDLGCDGSICRFADNTATEIACDGSPGQCGGVGWFVRVAGVGDFDRANYRLTASVARAQAYTCVPDLFEADALFQQPTRVFGGVGSQAIEVVNSNFTILPGVPITLRGRRSCGVTGPSNELADVDYVSVYARGGETLRMTVQQSAPVQSLSVRVVNTRDVPPSVVFEGAADTVSVSHPYVATQFGLHGVGVVRPKNQNTPGYVDSAPYTFTLERLPFGFVADTGCTPAPPTLSLVNNRVVVNGELIGTRDDIRPLGCPGGRGPDRTYAVRVPAGGGVLRATVTALDDVTDPEVSIRGTCNAGNSEIACNEDDLTAPDPGKRALAQAVVQGGAAGRDYFVNVDSPDTERAGAYQLELRYLTAADCDLNTGICNDPCEGVVCNPGNFCDTNDGACVACLVDNQCNNGSRCLSRRCVAGADRPISSWGDDGQDEPDCVTGQDCTVAEQCITLPFNGGKFCAMGCGSESACPLTYDCCIPQPIVAQFGLQPLCVPSTHPFRAQLCQP